MFVKLSLVRRPHRLGLSLALGGWMLASAPAAMASISNLDDLELFAIVWDPVREASYSLDLGIKANEFRISAQQDAGVQQFWKLDAATDTNFASLRAMGTAVDSLRWSVLAFDVQNDTFSDGEFHSYVTVQQGPAEGVDNQNYLNLTRAENLTYKDSVAQSGVYVDALNATNGQSPNGDIVNYAYNGSSFDVKGTPGYFGAIDIVGGVSTFNSLNVSLTNAVGKSSWFYALTDGGDQNDLLVDEFDNIAHDGYWGLALNPADGSFALSYTLESATRTASQREFAFSIGRSEFNGGFAVRKLAYTDLGTTPQSAGDFTRRLTHDITRSSFTTPTSAVPEPQTWGLMLAGLTGVAAIARRRRSA